MLGEVVGRTRPSAIGSPPIGSRLPPLNAAATRRSDADAEHPAAEARRLDGGVGGQPRRDDDVDERIGGDELLEVAAGGVADESPRPRRWCSPGAGTSRCRRYRFSTDRAFDDASTRRMRHHSCSWAGFGHLPHFWCWPVPPARRRAAVGRAAPRRVRLRRCRRRPRRPRCRSPTRRRSSFTGPPRRRSPPCRRTCPKTGPNTRPGEKPPLMPLEATQHTPEGAKAFAEFFIKTIDWGYATVSSDLHAPLLPRRVCDRMQNLRRHGFDKVAQSEASLHRRSDHRHASTAIVRTAVPSAEITIAVTFNIQSFEEVDQSEQVREGRRRAHRRALRGLADLEASLVGATADG